MALVPCAVIFRRKQVRMAKLFHRFSLEGQVKVCHLFAMRCHAMPCDAMHLQHFARIQRFETKSHCGQGFLRSQRRHLCYSGSSFPRTLLSRPIASGLIARLTGCLPTCRDCQVCAISILVDLFLHRSVSLHLITSN